MEQGWNVSEIICTLPSLKLCYLEKSIFCSCQYTQCLVTKMMGIFLWKTQLINYWSNLLSQIYSWGFLYCLFIVTERTGKLLIKRSSTFHFSVYLWPPWNILDTEILAPLKPCIHSAAENFVGGFLQKGCACFWQKWIPKSGTSRADYTSRSRSWIC